MNNPEAAIAGRSWLNRCVIVRLAKACESLEENARGLSRRERKGVQTRYVATAKREEAGAYRADAGRSAQLVGTEETACCAAGGRNGGGRIVRGGGMDRLEVRRLG